MNVVGMKEKDQELRTSSNEKEKVQQYILERGGSMETNRSFSNYLQSEEWANSFEEAM